jgi:hypothetical protein
MEHPEPVVRRAVDFRGYLAEAHPEDPQVAILVHRAALREAILVHRVGHRVVILVHRVAHREAILVHRVAHRVVILVHRVALREVFLVAGFRYLGRAPAELAL